MTTVDIRPVLAGRPVSRAEVLDWERRRIAVVAKKLGVDVDSTSNLATQRDRLTAAKLRLADAPLPRRIVRETRIADALASAQARVSPRRTVSVTDLEVTGGDAEQFVTWFTAVTDRSDEEAMLRACPDHYRIRTGADGRQEVVETTGGSPLAARFFVDYTDQTSLQTPADDAFDFQVAGVARSIGGRPVGGVRHQFRNTANGFHARLTVEFPLPTLPTMVAGHRLHLACEFSNWIDAALAE